MKSMARGTHSLLSARGTPQDNEREKMPRSDGYSQTVERSKRDSSGQQKKASE